MHIETRENHEKLLVWPVSQPRFKTGILKIKVGGVTTTPDMSNTQPVELHEAACSSLDIYKVLLSFLLDNTSKKFCKMKYKEYFTFVHCSTVKNLQKNSNKGM
jgi:hypothetical protein